MPSESTPDQIRLNVIIEGEDDGVQDWDEEVGKSHNHVDADEIATEPTRELLHTSSSVPAREI